MVAVYRNSEKRRRFQDRTGDRLSSRDRALWSCPELTSCGWDRMGPDGTRDPPQGWQVAPSLSASLPGSPITPWSWGQLNRPRQGGCGSDRSYPWGPPEMSCSCHLSEKGPSGQTRAPWKQSECLPSSPAGSPDGPVGGERGRLSGPTPASPKLVQSRMWTLGL